LAIATLRTEKKIKPIEAHRPTLTKHELESVLDCLIQDRLGSGQTVERFEKSLSSTFGYKHVLALNSLASAYHLAFLTLDLGQNDTVLMSALAPIQACDAARYTGASVYLIDVDRNSFHASMDRVRDSIEKIEAEKGRAPAIFILDHTFGSPSPIDAAYLREKGIKIVEDFSGLVGTEIGGQFAGNTGAIAVCGLSEYDLITTGNGAFAVTSDPKLHAKMHASRYGSKRGELSLAYDYRLEDFQAAMGLDQLSRLGVNLGRRKKIGQKYLETLRGTKHETYFNDPGIDAYWKFPIVISRGMDEVMRYFRSVQIGVSRTIEYPLHHVLGHARMEFPNVERIYQKSISIPVYPALSANNVERIASSLRGLL